MKRPELWNDPIVDEIHRIRLELLEESGGNLESLGAWLMRSQERHGDKLVTLPPQVIDPPGPPK